MMIAFSHLEPGQLRELWKHFVYKKYTSDVRIFEQGDDADVFYVIYSGSVSARIPKQTIIVRRPSERSERGRLNTRRGGLEPFEHPVGGTT